jgi:hypothetical protein
MLLPSDTHRKPITSIAAVLHPLVMYLLTLPRIIMHRVYMTKSSTIQRETANSFTSTKTSEHC